MNGKEVQIRFDASFPAIHFPTTEERFESRPFSKKSGGKIEFSRWITSGLSPFSKRSRSLRREAIFSAARLFRLMFLGGFMGEMSWIAVMTTEKPERERDHLSIFVPISIPYVLPLLRRSVGTGSRKAKPPLAYRTPSCSSPLISGSFSVLSPGGDGGSRIVD